jgi:D-alanine-D-alanine ligase-like ATP-grasp enzyme
VEMTRGAFRALGCHGFATADFRLSPDSKLYLLELNPNANLNPSRCLTELLSLAGIEYTDFLVQLVRSAYAQQTLA